MKNVDEWRDFWHRVLQFGWEFIQQSGEKYIVTFFFLNLARKRKKWRHYRDISRGWVRLFMMTRQNWIHSKLCICVCLMRCFDPKMRICSLGWRKQVLLLLKSQNWAAVKRSWLGSITLPLIIWGAAPDLCNRIRNSKCWTPPPLHHHHRPLRERICCRSRALWVYRDTQKLSLSSLLTEYPSAINEGYLSQRQAHNNRFVAFGFR